LFVLTFHSYNFIHNNVKERLNYVVRCILMAMALPFRFEQVEEGKEFLLRAINRKVLGDVYEGAVKRRRMGWDVRKGMIGVGGGTDVELQTTKVGGAWIRGCWSDRDGLLFKSALLHMMLDVSLRG
jgi:hypothetical protein